MQPYPQTQRYKRWNWAAPPGQCPAVPIPRHEAAAPLKICQTIRQAATKRASLVILVMIALMLMVVAVVVVVVPMGVPFPAGIFVVTSIAVGVANPPARRVVDIPIAILRLAPTPITIMVASDSNAVVAIRIASLVSVSDHRGRCRKRKHTDGLE